MNGPSTAHLHSLAMALLLLALASHGAHAQDSARVAAARALRPGQMVRVETPPLGRLEGRFVGTDATMLTIIRDSLPTVIRLPDVQRLWVRGRATGTGALIGAGVGLLSGVLGGLLIGAVACEPIDGGDCTTAEVAALLGLIGGAGGAAVGAGVGYAIPVWRLRFP